MRRWLVAAWFLAIAAACDSRPVYPLDRDEPGDGGAPDAGSGDGAASGLNDAG